jgi:hypothetical protein
VKSCRRVRWQEPGNPAGSTVLDDDEIHAIDEERRRTGIARAGRVEAAKGDRADSESSDESEYDDVEEDNEDADLEPSGEVNLYSDDREPVDAQQETPQGIQDVICKLYGASLQSISIGLTMEIACWSAFSPSGSSIPLEISMFVTRSTHRSRSQQLFVCCHPGCSGFLRTIRRVIERTESLGILLSGFENN